MKSNRLEAPVCAAHRFFAFVILIFGLAGIADAPAFGQTAATLTPVSGSGQSAVVDTVFANALKVIVQDASGNTLANTPVTFTAPAGPVSSTATAIFNGASNTITVTTDATGTATVPASQLKASQKAAQYNVDVTSGSASTAILLINGPGAAATISVSDGAGQQGTILTGLPVVFKALLVDTFGNPAPGVGVTFTAPAGGASGNFSGSLTALTTTNAAGIATAPAFTLNGVAGVYNVTANATVAPLATPANFNLINLPSLPSQITVSQGSGQSTDVMLDFDLPLQALVRDANNNPVPNVNVTFTAPSSGASGTFGGSLTVTVATNAAGIAIAPALTANAVAGSFNVSAAFSGGPVINFALTNIAGSAASVTANTGNNQSATITLNFATNLSVVLKDAHGNFVSGAIVTFTAPSSGASGLFGGSATTSAVTDSSGVATASVFKANATAGSYTVTATSTGIVTPFVFTLANVNPSAILVNGGAGQSATISKAFGTAMSAKVTDAGGTGIAGMTVTFTAPASGASGLFGASLTATAVTNASGIATASAFTANTTAGSYTVDATVAGVAAPASFALTNNNPAAIAVQSGNNQQATISTAYPTLMSAKVTDSGGAGIAGLTVTFTAPSSGASGLFGATLTKTAVTDASGIATATAFTANATAGSYTVDASVTGLAAVASFTLTNLAPTPFSIAASPAGSTPQFVSINSVFGTALGVIVKDLNGIVMNNIPVTFTVNAVGGAGATFTGGLAVWSGNTNAAGIVTAAALTANGTAGTYTVTATAGSLTFTFTLTNRAAASIAVTGGAPQVALISTNFASQLQVTVLDGSSNPVSGAIVTFSVPGSGASATLSSTTATTNASGVASVTATANAAVGTYVATAAVAGVATPANFGLTNNAPNSIAAVLGGATQTAVINTNFGVLLQATVLDAVGGPVVGATVTFTAPGSGASGLFGATVSKTAVTNGLGIATATAFTANATVGSYVVTASVSGVATPASYNLTNTLATPVSAVASPSNATPQSAAINTAFATALGVLVKDGGGAIIANLPVTFTVNAVGGAGATFAGGVSTITVNTNGSGIATAPTLTANGTAGTYTVTATAGSLTVTFTLSNTSVPATIAAFAGDNQSATIQTNFATALQARVLDAGGNPVVGAVVVFTAPTTGARAAFAGGSTATATTNASGIATAPAALAGTVTGSFSITATVQATAVSTAFTLANTPGAAATITIVSGNGQTRALGADYTQVLVAVVKDGSGNIIPNASVTFNAPTTGARVTFAGGVASATVTSDVSGNATSPVLTAAGATGAVTISAKVNNTTPQVNFTVTNISAVPGAVSVQSGSPQTTMVNTNFATALQAKVLDTQGNPSAGVTVTFSVPVSGASGAFGGSVSVTATTNASGVATSPVLRANTASGTFYAQASVSGVASPAIYTMTNTPDTPVAISILSGTPQSAFAGTAFAAPLVALVKDVYGNPVPGASVSFLAPTIGSVASFPGSASSATVTTDATGKATAPTLTANAIAGTYTVTASIPAGAFVNYNLTNTPAPASIAAVGASTQTTPVTTAFGTALTVTVKDATNLPVPGVTVTFAAPGSGASATLSSTTAVTNASGVASITVTANATAGSYAVTATVTGIATPLTFNLTNTAGAPTSISATGGVTQSALVTTAFATPLAVTVKDGSNNPVSGVVVTFTVPASGASSVLSSLTATTNALGIASVTATANATVGAYSVTASVAGIATPISFSLTNTVGAPASISATGGVTQSALVTTAFATPLAVTVKDGSNNPVSGVVVTFTVPATGASSALSSLTATTNALGVASVSATANATAGTYSVTASVTGIATPISFSLTNTVGAPASISATGGVTQSALVTTTFATPLAVTVKDGSNNPVSGVVVTFTVPASGASSVLSSLTATTNALGVATVTATANGSVGTYIVTAKVAGIATAISYNLTNTVGAPSSISATGGVTQSALVATAFGTPLQVTVKDGSNNPVPGVTVTFTAPASGASSVLSSTTATTNALGVASVTATANGMVGTYSVTAIVAGIPTPISFSLTNTGTPGVTLTVTGSPNLIGGPGQSVVFTYVAVNTGNVAISTLAVSDVKVPNIVCPATVLAVNATMTCKGTYVSTMADLTAGRITSVARVIATTVAGPATSPAVTTIVGVDVEGIRKRTVDAAKQLMQDRARVLTSMEPNAQRLHNRLTSPLFGDAGEPAEAPEGERHEPLKIAGTPAANDPRVSSLGGGIASIIEPRQSNRRGATTGNSGLPVTADGRDEKAPGAVPFSFNGESEEGNGRFSFAASLSQMRATARNDESAKPGVSGGNLNGPANGNRGKLEDVFDIWVEGQAAYFKSDLGGARRQGHAAVLYAGADVIVRPGIAVGVLVQRDWVSEHSSVSTHNSDGAGWMAGPYIGMRLTKNLYFDARYAWGEAANSINPIGAYTDTFKTTRELASARLTGDWVKGAWRFRPMVDATYFTEQQKSYVNQVGIVIPESRVKLGRVTFGPEFAYRMQLSNKSYFEPYFGIKGVFDFAHDKSVMASGAANSPDDFTGRLEIGASYVTPTGVSLRASGTYDGLGGADYRAIQGQAFVIVPLN